MLTFKCKRCQLKKVKLKKVKSAKSGRLGEIARSGRVKSAKSGRLGEVARTGRVKSLKSGRLGKIARSGRVKSLKSGRLGEIARSGSAGTECSVQQGAVGELPANPGPSVLKRKEPKGRERGYLSEEWNVRLCKPFATFSAFIHQAKGLQEAAGERYPRVLPHTAPSFHSNHYPFLSPHNGNNDFSPPTTLFIMNV
jgi:hypothetical protein